MINKAMSLKKQIKRAKKFASMGLTIDELKAFGEQAQRLGSTTTDLEIYIMKDCSNCEYKEFKTTDYKYHLHVPGGFLGCSILRKGIEFIEKKECPKKNDIKNTSKE